MIRMKRICIALLILAIGIVGAISIGTKFLGGGRLPPNQWITDDLGSIGTQLELFKAQHGRYPTSKEGLDALVHRPNDPAIAGKWLQQLKLIDRDPWGHPYEYRCPGPRHPGSFDLYSLGPDGVESGDDVYFSEYWQAKQAVDKAWNK